MAKRVPFQAMVEIGKTQLDSYVKIRDRQTQEYRRARNREERQEVRKRTSKEAIAALKELLTPRQQTRLRQVLYRQEMATVGLGHALTRGYLSKLIEPDG